MVTLTGVELHRGGRRLLGPIDLSLTKPGITVVLGPNGAGKTTLLRVLHGLEPPTSGTVTGAPDRQGFVFQTPTMLRRTVLDNIAYPLRLAGVGKAEARAKAKTHADDLGLGGLLARPARVLSGGEKQKLALARALITKPDLLFLDEPCASLDGQATRDIETILQNARTGGVQVVMSTHNVAQARRLADEVVFIYHGRLHERGACDQFFQSPATAEARAHITGGLLP